MNRKIIMFLAEEMVNNGKVNIERDKINLGKVIFPSSDAFHDMGYEIIYIEIYSRFSIDKLTSIGHKNGIGVHEVIDNIKEILNNKEARNMLVDICFSKSDKLKHLKAKSSETEVDHAFLKENGIYEIQINSIAEEA